MVYYYLDYGTKFQNYCLLTAIAVQNVYHILILRFDS